MTISRRTFLRDSAQCSAVPLLGAAAPLLAAPPPAGIDIRWRPSRRRPEGVAKDITVKDVAGLAVFAGAGCNVVALAGPDGALLVDGGLAVNSGAAAEGRARQARDAPHRHADQHALASGADRPQRGRGQGRRHHHRARGHAACAGRKERSPLFDGTIGAAARRPRARRRPPTTRARCSSPASRWSIATCRARTPTAICSCYFPKRNVIVAGGPVTSDRWPVIDYLNGGFMHGFLRSYEILSRGS